MKIAYLILACILTIQCSAQIAFRNPSGLMVVAPPPAFGVTTIYDYVVTDGRQQWRQNTYNWRAQIPVGDKRCKIYLWVREYVNQIPTNRKFYIFYEENN